MLIVGEPGTGKRLVARTIHQHGPRRHAPLLPFDCAALPAEVLERELFGIRRGRTSARLVLPDGSTLLIDDVLDLPRDLQARLAATSTRGSGCSRRRPATPRPRSGTSGSAPDLYYALTTLVIRVHPLRERLDELPLLAQHLLERANLRGGRQRSGFSAEALDALLAYDWPGNLRELARVVDEAHARGDGGRDRGRRPPRRDPRPPRRRLQPAAAPAPSHSRSTSC